MLRKKIILVFLLSLISGTVMAQEAKVTPLMSKDLKDFPGKEGVLITVEYPPGATDPIHRHNAHAFVYVLEGSIVMQLKGGKEVTLTPGQTFYEGPDDVHIVGRSKQNQASKIRCVLGQEQRRSSARASEVTGERLFPLVPNYPRRSIETHRRNELLWFNKRW